MGREYVLLIDTSSEVYCMSAYTCTFPDSVRRKQGEEIRASYPRPDLSTESDSPE